MSWRRAELCSKTLRREQSGNGNRWFRLGPQNHHTSSSKLWFVSCRLRSLHRCQPAKRIVGFSSNDIEELSLNFSSDRSAPSRANLNLVNRTNRCDLCSRSGEEDLVGDVKHLTRDRALKDWDSHSLA